MIAVSRTASHRLPRSRARSQRPSGCPAGRLGGLPRIRAENVQTGLDSRPDWPGRPLGQIGGQI